jgi:quercetin dioxygenase-like cupin family protein
MSGHYPDKFRSLPVYDGRFDAYKLAAEGADVLLASYKAGTQIPEHQHDTDNYGVIIRGELILTMNGQTTRHGCGDWYHVPAFVPHSAAFEQETDEIEFWFAVNETSEVKS